MSEEGSPPPADTASSAGPPASNPPRGPAADEPSEGAPHAAPLLAAAASGSGPSAPQEDHSWTAVDQGWGDYADVVHLEGGNEGSWGDHAAWAAADGGEWDDDWGDEEGEFSDEGEDEDGEEEDFWGGEEWDEHAQAEWEAQQGMLANMAGALAQEQWPTGAEQERRPEEDSRTSVLLEQAGGGVGGGAPSSGLPPSAGNGQDRPSPPRTSVAAGISAGGQTPDLASPEGAATPASPDSPQSSPSTPRSSLKKPGSSRPRSETPRKVSIGATKVELVEEIRLPAAPDPTAEDRLQAVNDGATGLAHAAGDAGAAAQMRSAPAVWQPYPAQMMATINAGAMGMVPVHLPYGPQHMQMMYAQPPQTQWGKGASTFVPPQPTYQQYYHVQNQTAWKGTMKGGWGGSPQNMQAGYDQKGGGWWPAQGAQTQKGVNVGDDAMAGSVTGAHGEEQGTPAAAQGDQASERPQTPVLTPKSPSEDTAPQAEEQEQLAKNAEEISQKEREEHAKSQQVQAQQRALELEAQVSADEEHRGIGPAPETMTAEDVAEREAAERYGLGIFTSRRFTAGNVWGIFNGRGLTTSS